MKPIDPARQTRWHLLITALTLFGSGSLVLWSMSAAGSAQSEYEQALRTIRQTEQKKQATLTENEERARLLPLYEKALQSAVTTPLDTQTKAEKLLALQSELQIPALRYEFLPQLTLPAPGEASFNFISHKLKLQLELTHEEEFLKFFKYLPERAAGIINIQHCQLALSKTSELNADCEIDWINLVQKKP